MKTNQLITICSAAAALCLSAAGAMAQNDNGGGGGGGFGGGGFGRGGGFDPAQMQQRMMDNIREDLGFTNDTDWSAVQPLIQKVMDARRDVGVGGGFGRIFRNRGGRGGNGGNGGGGFGGGPGGGRGFGQQQPSPETEALQQAVDNNAPTAQVKAALERYETAQKAKQAKLTEAQENLRKVLTVKQEAEATLLGLLE